MGCGWNGTLSIRGAAWNLFTRHLLFLSHNGQGANRGSSQRMHYLNDWAHPVHVLLVIDVASQPASIYSLTSSRLNLQINLLCCAGAVVHRVAGNGVMSRPVIIYKVFYGDPPLRLAYFSGLNGKFQGSTRGTVQASTETTTLAYSRPKHFSFSLCLHHRLNHSTPMARHPLLKPSHFSFKVAAASNKSAALFAGFQPYIER